MGKEKRGKASIPNKLLIYCMFRAVFGMDPKAWGSRIKSFLFKGKQDLFKKKKRKRWKASTQGRQGFIYSDVAFTKGPFVQ